MVRQDGFRDGSAPEAPRSVRRGPRRAAGFLSEPRASDAWDGAHRDAGADAIRVRPDAQYAERSAGRESGGRALAVAALQEAELALCTPDADQSAA
jgi:hypothetical protein